jgi:hypothetical protein
MSSSKLEQKVKCDYCDQMVPQFRPSARYGYVKLVHKLPNGLNRCVICRENAGVGPGENKGA